MLPVSPRDLAHDLRNLLGLVRAIAADLSSQLAPRGGELADVATDLDRSTRFALDALRVIEKWDERAAVDVQLGAWAWALKLVRREIRVGEVSSVGRANLVVPDAIDAGTALVDAMAAGHVVNIDAIDASVCFEVVGGRGSAGDLTAAIERIRGLGLDARIAGERPLRVLVGPK
jgi:hypothetical protein